MKENGCRRSGYEGENLGEDDGIFCLKKVLKEHVDGLRSRCRCGM
jgi:hypothetical protein